MSTATTATAHGLVALSYVRDTLIKMLDTMSENQLLHQPGPGTNHAHWIAGHLAVTDDFFGQKFADRPAACPEAWSGLFGHGSEPDSAGAGYPTLAEIRKTMDRVHAELVGFFGQAGPETLARDLPDDWRSFAPTIGDLPAGMAAHEGMHVGQLATVRKSLGMKPVMM